jgi:hypothetical protein
MIKKDIMAACLGLTSIFHASVMCDGATVFLNRLNSLLTLIQRKISTVLFMIERVISITLRLPS